MFEKMTPNQRLLVAVLISIVFFVAYTAIFPPEQPPVQEEAKKGSVETTQKPSVEKVSGHKISEVEKADASASSDLVVINNEKFVLKIDSLGRISSKELLEEKFRDKENLHAQIISTEAVKKPLELKFLDPVVNNLATTTPYTSSVANATVTTTNPVKVTLTQKLPELTVQKILTFYADGHYDVKISTSSDVRYYVFIGDRPKVTDQMMTVNGSMIYTSDDVSHITEDGDAEGRQVFQGVELASAFDQYTATIMYGFKPNTNVMVERGFDNNPVVYFEAENNNEFHGYIGPKEHKVLEAINPVLVNAIEYGWFTFAAKPLFSLLSWLHSIFGNWGWAIIALTAIVRAVLYPLTHKGMMSMQKMKELAPQLKEIKEKYGKDPQRMNAATMEMYKKHGANPLGGCLPMLLQIPVFFAIYRVLLNAVELQGAPWILWVTDLSRPDYIITFGNGMGIPILAFFMGASMYYQQRLTPNNFTDPMQEKIFKYLPVIFTLFFLGFASGLVLYWFVNNLFSIAQQFVVNQQFKNAKDAKEAVKKSNGK